MIDAGSVGDAVFEAHDELLEVPERPTGRPERGAVPVVKVHA
jgi:hypothetical protein